ncbi:MAG TPA: hypothetical protein VF257_11090, partial [Solirubrobacteraceae bacterium]
VESPAVSPPLSAVLDLTVLDLTAGRTVFAGKLDQLGTVTLGDLAQGEQRRYRFLIAFPTGRAPAADNAYQLTSTSVSYVWTAGAAAPGTTPPRVLSPQTAGPPTLHRPTARLTVARRQRPRDARLRVTLVCQARCRARVTARATVGRKRVPLRSVARSVAPARRVVLRLALPRRVRAALSAGRSVVVRLQLRATIAGRVVTVQRTVRVLPVRRSRS